MKHLLPLVLATAAAFGAIHQSAPDALSLAASSPSLPADPPWLRSDWPTAGDPHAALDEGGAAHAGTYESDDPHAGLYLGDDPHAEAHGSGVHAAAHEAHGSAPNVCPHLGGEAVEALDAAPGDPHAAPRGHAALLQVGLQPQTVTASVAANGHSIADVHARRSALAEQTIRVRGTVVKRTDGILGKSFVHLWDGSAAPETGADDLTVTTSEEFQIGETVELEGRLLIDQDLGLGYRYAALLDGAARVAAH
jgi:hypothetical protein